MKKYIVILLIPVLFGCGRQAKERVAVLQARNDSLVTQTSQKDVAINDFMKSVNDIQSILDSIKRKENIISRSTQVSGEMKPSARNQIRSDIMTIYSLMLKDKHQLAVLSEKLKSSGLKIDEFQKMVDHLRADVRERDSTLAVLNDRLTKLDAMYAAANKKIDTLNTTVASQGQQLSDQSKIISDQTISLNTAYYIEGTAKQLKNEKIIKGKKLLPDFNRSLFTKVDIRNVTEIPVDTRKVKLITNHPPSSYKLVTEGKVVKSLKVTNEKDFWSTSKYLVMITD